MNHFFKELLGLPLTLPASGGIPSHPCTASSFFYLIPLGLAPPVFFFFSFPLLRGCKGSDLFRSRKIFF
jgi:hypothetical protein